MAKSLFIDGNDVFRNTLIQADTDPDKLIPFIEAFQDVELQDWLGANFYTVLDDLVFNAGQTPTPADNINAAARASYKAFIQDHLQRIVEQGAAALYLEYAKFTVSNKGVFVHGATDSTPATSTDVRKIIQRIDERKEFYMERAQDFLCNNPFPEYIISGNTDLPPSYDTYDFGFTTL